jgi:hypothetical protein
MLHLLQTHFSSIRDKRQTGKIEHSLIDIITLCICGVVASTDGWSDVADSLNSRINDNFQKLKSAVPAF